MTAPKKPSTEDLAALQSLSRYHEGASQKWASTFELGRSSARLAVLVRYGWARSTEQGEKVRGEREIRYRLYQITPTGLAALRQAATLAREAGQ